MVTEGFLLSGPDSAEATPSSSGVWSWGLAECEELVEAKGKDEVTQSTKGRLPRRDPWVSAFEEWTVGFLSEASHHSSEASMAPSSFELVMREHLVVSSSSFQEQHPHL